MVTPLSYGQAVECKLQAHNMNWCGTEGYLVGTTINLAALALVASVALGELKLPPEITDLLQGPLYSKEWYQTGLMWGAVCGVGRGLFGACYNAWEPISESQADKQEKWAQRPPHSKAGEVGCQSACLLTRRVINRAFCWGFMALVARLKVGQGFWSTLSGFTTAWEVSLIAGHLGGSLLTWQREAVDIASKFEDWFDIDFDDFGFDNPSGFDDPFDNPFDNLFDNPFRFDSRFS